MLYNLVHLDYNTLQKIDRGLLLIRSVFVTLSMQLFFVSKYCAHCLSFLLKHTVITTDIIEDDMVSNPEGFTDKIPISPMTSTTVKKPRAKK